MVRVKTSIYVDRELWEKIKAIAARRGLEVSRALEELMCEELLDDALDEVVKRVGETGQSSIDFKPVKPREGLVSSFVRVMRDERTSSLS